MKIRKKFTYSEADCLRCFPESSEDKVVIEEVVKQLPLIADLINADLFVDCNIAGTKDTICVAEAISSDKEPLYHECPVGADCPPEKEPAVWRTFTYGTNNRDVLGTSQEMFPIRQNVVPIWGSREQPIGVLIREFHAEAEDKLAFLEEASAGVGDALYSMWERELPNKISEAVLILDREGQVTYHNKEALTLWHKLGYEGTILGENFQKLDDFKDIYAAAEKTYDEFQNVTVKDIVLEVKSFAQDHNGQICLLIHDISNERAYERQLRMQSFMTKEMNHRIKNNLQTIASLLNIQSSRTDDQEVKMLFYESVNRILSIAEVHNALSHSGADKVHIIPIIERICENIAKMSEICYCVAGTDSELTASKASTLGLVINELVQNTAKHARVRENEQIQVNISVNNVGSMISVVVSDNGGGIRETDSSGMGIQLVMRLIKETLSGEVVFNSTSVGTTITISFLKD